MQIQTTTYYCLETRQFAVFHAAELFGGVFADPQMAAHGALRQAGGSWFFAGSLLHVCERFAETGRVLIGDGAPEAEADAVFATKHRFDMACIQMCGWTVEERAEAEAAEREAA